MPTLDLRDPELRAKYGLRPQNADTVSIPSRWRKQPKQDHRSRVETQRLILQTLAAADRPLSRTQIMRAIGRSKCPRLLDVIAEMVALGLIIEHESSYRHLFMYVYEVA